MLAHIPKSRLCFGEKSFLNFHQARVSEGGPVSLVVARCQGWRREDAAARLLDDASERVVADGLPEVRCLTILTDSQRLAHWNWCREFIDREAFDF